MEDLRINIIGIKDTGKKILDSIDFNKINELLEGANKVVFKPIHGPYYNNTYSIEKYYLNDIFEANNIDSNYYTFSIIDGLDYNDSYKPRNNRELRLNIFLSMNSNISSTKHLKIINVSDKDILDVLLNLINIVIPTPKFIDYDLIDFDLFFEENYNYKAILVKGNIFNVLVDKYILELKKIDNLKEIFTIINTSSYSIGDFNYLINKIEEAKVCSTFGFSSASSNDIIDDNTIVAICKVKE